MQRPSRPFWLLLTVVFLLLPLGASVHAQAPVITMTMQAGFDGRFRDSEWMPVIVHVTNSGDPIQGALVVRPETSGAGITSTFSAPVDLPAGANQTVTLYVNARAYAAQVRVELIDTAGVIVSAVSAPIRVVNALDWLSVVVSTSAAGTVDVTGAKAGGYDAYQANWRVQDIPDRADALMAVDLMLFSDVDSGQLSTAQRAAVADWVAEGGHLVVTGGAPWQSTAAGLTDLLPLQPNGSASVASLTPLADWLKTGAPAALDLPTVVATGALASDARVLVSSADQTPLLARRTRGGGMVDYLTADPNSQPLRGWGGLSDLWLTLRSTEGVKPSWAYGVTNWDAAGSATEILPGFNLLPDALPLCGFLALYIGLIGPLNYAILSRLNRRELAWVTIPLLIVIFSGLAWALGFNLRGTEATLSRLTVVRSWPDAERAQVNELTGLLSPRRAAYTLSLNDNGLLQPILRPPTRSGLLGSDVQASVDIRQSDVFRATDFLVDASFIAGFNATAEIDRPAIDGSATISYEGDGGQQRARGSVRNSSDQTLNDAVILARGATVRLGQPLAPGAVATFDLTLSGEGPPSPGPYAPATRATMFSMPSYYSTGAYGLPRTAVTTAGDIMGDRSAIDQNSDSTIAQENRRRWLFLGSFVNDYFTSTYNYSSSTLAATGRGDSIYLAGWTSEALLPIGLEGAQWNSHDSTLYLVELATTPVKPTAPVTISRDRFTWLTVEKPGVADEAPIDLSLQPGEQVSFRFTPLPAAVLSTVNRLSIDLQHTSLGATAMPAFLYNWRDRDWEQVQLATNHTEFNDPARFLGPENAIIVRLNADLVGGYLHIDQLSVEQEGTF